MVKSRKEPQRQAANMNRQLPALLTSTEFQPIFTQRHLDLSMYGYAKVNNPQKQATVCPALSGLRPTGLSYGILIRLIFLKNNSSNFY